MPSPLRMRTLVSILLLLLTLAPKRAQAWTEARVESAQARVEVDDSGEAEVELELLIYVRRGWLTSLTLAGFDPGLTLSETEPPSLRPVEAEAPVRRPEVELRDDGSLRLSFPRREAPHRGRYRLRLRYRTSLTSDPGGAADARFTLPGFEAGLDGVQLSFRAPLGTRLAAGSLPEATTEVEVSEVAGRSLLSLRRAHVPRTVPWRVGLIFPHMTATPSASQTSAAPAPRLLRSVPRRAPWVLALTMVALGLLRRRRFAARASRLALKPSPLIPFLPSLARDATLVVAALGYARALPEQPLAALVFLTLATLVQLERVPTRLRPARPGAFRLATPEDRARARRLRIVAPLKLDAMLDATQASGLLCLALLIAGLCALARLEASATSLAASVPFASLWFVPTFVSGHRRTLPPEMSERLAWADALMESLAAPAWDAQVVLHGAMNGETQDVRVQVELKHPEAGLLRLQLLLAPSPGLGLTHTQTAALIVTRPASAADRACAGALPQTSAWTSGDRRARLRPLADDLPAQLSALAHMLSRNSDAPGEAPIAVVRAA